MISAFHYRSGWHTLWWGKDVEIFFCLITEGTKYSEYGQLSVDDFLVNNWVAI